MSCATLLLANIANVVSDLGTPASSDFPAVDFRKRAGIAGNLRRSYLLNSKRNKLTNA
jgi:hypothetical protein